MNKEKAFDNVLDECLERLLVKGETIGQCLQSYPEQATRLKPLLQTALAIKEASAIQPRAEFKARARYQLHAALQEAASRRSRPFFGWLPRWATVVVIVAIILLAGGGTVAAASYSMPDSPLYPAKLTTERVQLMLTFSDIDKARLCARLADRRVAEIIYMANKGDAQQVEAITQRLDKHLVMLTSLVPAAKEDSAPRALAPLPELAPSEEAGAGKDSYTEGNNRAKLKMTVARYAINHPEALRMALEEAPESAKPALRRSIAISVASYEKALKALD